MTKQNRDSIREEVFKRDVVCVVPHCNAKPDDAHHLIERKLWNETAENGGYLMDNLVSVCEFHHKMAENNTILPRTLREYAGIEKSILPATFDQTKEYDKWGKVLENPAREKLKYPHTPYLPFSPNSDEKDVRESGYMDIRNLLNKPLLITTKMDGSNVVMTRTYVAARNGYDATGTSFDMLKQTHAMMAHIIPENEMWFGEWLYAKHSIHYTGELSLDGYMQLFGIYDKSTRMWLGAAELNDSVCEVLCETDNPNILSSVKPPKGISCGMGFLEKNFMFSDEKSLKAALIKLGNQVIKEGHEGIVVRNAYPFHHARWKDNIAKYVRANHVQTDQHWSQQPIVRNECNGNKTESVDGRNGD